MASQQLTQMNELYASIKERISKPELDSATRRGHRGEPAFGRQRARDGHLSASGRRWRAGTVVYHAGQRPGPPTVA
jgi:hypothetical protein